MIAIAILIILLTILIDVQRRLIAGRRSLTRVNRALFVIAHPDDETMFFAPTIIGLIDAGCQVYLMCLSSGDYRRGEALTRKHELLIAAQRLGITAEHIMIVEHSLLPDNPDVEWDCELVGAIILRQVETLDIDSVVTFDEMGVSGHVNHRSLFAAVQRLYSRGAFPTDTQVFVLESVSRWRKYIAAFDIGPSALFSTFCYVSSWRETLRAVWAMCAHWSQLRWFRILYVIFSRYMTINTLHRIAMEARFYRYS